jgi:four helix bundle protein
VTIESYRDLRVWQAGKELVVRIYRITRAFPGDERFGLTSQMRRASVSIPSNIAEGHARESSREYLHHLSIAQGSLAELETQVELSEELGFLDPDERADFFQHSQSLGRQPFALRNALNRRVEASGRYPPSPGSRLPNPDS